MQHYVLTRSSYPPSYPLEANRRRLELTERVTARSLASQTERAWRWVVVVHPQDPLLDERMDVLELAGVPIITVPVRHRTQLGEVTPDGRLPADVDGPGGPWHRAIAAEVRDGRVATTRLDDDDALATDAIARIRAAATTQAGPVALILPVGYRWHRGRVERMRHLTNMFVTLDSPGRPLHVVMGFKHNAVRETWPVRTLDSAPGWLWVRHNDTRSGSRSARLPLRSDVQELFDVDWPYLRSVA